MSWKDEQQGPKWVPLLNQEEAKVGLPADLLARIAYQECRFREDTIRGTTVSSAGALGMMQLMPKFFTSVNVPIPYSDSAVMSQMEEAAHFLEGLFIATHDWDLTIAAYNAGLGNVRKYNGIPPFPETQAYVAQVTADVPSLA